MEGSSRTILAPVSAGHLLDRLSILELKLERIPEGDRREHVRREHVLLRAVVDREGLEALAPADAIAGLRQVNASLWEFEEAVRACEREGAFGARFVALARSIYRLNDERSAHRRRIDLACGSSIVGEKSFGTDEG